MESSEIFEIRNFSYVRFNVTEEKYDHYKTLLIMHSLIDMVITKPKSLSIPLRKVSNEIMNFPLRKKIFVSYFQKESLVI